MMALILGLAVVALVIVVALASRGGGPRVTHIDIRREHDKDEPEDRGDA
jgi:hypothetical protein